MPDRIRVVAYFSGHVQGVGFRFTALDVAERFPGVTGFVRNLRDRRVELVAEGSPADVDGFLQAVTAEMGAYIEDVTQRREPATGEFRSFSMAR